jgi:hypothetical protein
VATPQSLRARVERKLPRILKFCHQWGKRLGTKSPVMSRAVFVLGAQRSGTRLPLMVLDQSPDIITYSEGSDPFFTGVMLKRDDVIRRHLRRMPFPIVVLKPICESHRGVDLLGTFSGSSVVWIYRDYRDTVNSSVVKWQTGVKHLNSLARGDLKAAAWRAGGLTEEKLELVRQIYDDEMSLHAANAVMWYLRTSLFFDGGLAGRSDVLLVKYEDLVRNPNVEFTRLFEFLDCPFQSEYLSRIYSSSISRQPFPAIPARISDLCEGLMSRLDEYRLGANAQRVRG